HHLLKESIHRAQTGGLRLESGLGQVRAVLLAAMQWITVAGIVPERSHDQQERLMTITMRGTIEPLRAAMSGPGIGPADPNYDQARRVWNADIDRRPAVIARCLSPADVAAAVSFAADQNLEIAA